MKRAITSVFLVLCAFVAFAQDGKDGFRGMKWGTDLQKVKNTFEVVTTEDDLTYATRKGEEMKIYAVPVEQILYGFHQGNLSEVVISIKGRANWDSVRDGLIADFGRSDSYRIYTIYNRSGGDSIVDGVYNENTDTAVLKFTWPEYFYGR